MVESLRLAVWLDVGALLLCTATLATRSWFRLAHPGAFYLGFHAVFVTHRGVSLYRGTTEAFLGVPYDEIAAAIFIADLFLLSATAGWLYVGSKPAPRVENGAGSIRPLDAHAVALVSVFCVPFGLYALVSVGYVPGVESSAVVRGTYLELAIVWPAICAVAAIYRFGLRWYLTIPLFGYLLLMALQGFGRFRLILPLALLLLAVMERRRRRWPPLWMVAVILPVAVSFPTLKAMGQTSKMGR